MQDMIFPFRFIGAPPKDTALYKWFEIIVEGAARLGRPWTNSQHYKTWMEDIGFEDVVETNFYWPVNPWAKGAYFKQVALYAQVDFTSSLEGLSLKVMGSMGYSPEETKKLVAEVRDDVKNPAIHCYCPM